MSLADTLLSLKKQLYPDSRAFKMPPNSIFERLHKALALSEAAAWEDVTGILNSILPDNDNFTEYDAIQWCRRLGLIYNADVPLADTKAQILQKMAYPGMDNPPRQAASFLEYQLRQAGFDVYVYENRFFEGGEWITKTPSEILGAGVGSSILDTFELGEAELDGTWADAGITILANFLEEDKDADFDILNYRRTFFIAGETIDTFANVSTERKEQFRQMLLQLKPAQTIGILFVNYI